LYALVSLVAAESAGIINSTSINQLVIRRALTLGTSVAFWYSGGQASGRIDDCSGTVIAGSREQTSRAFRTSLVVLQISLSLASYRRWAFQ